jgi:hypothetical protein
LAAIQHSSTEVWLLAGGSVVASSLIGLGIYWIRWEWRREERLS